MSFPAWHPMVVHFPLALTVTGTCALVLARLARDSRHAAVLATVGTWNLVLGAIGIVAALGTGLAVLLDLQLAEEARRAVGLHVKWAVACALFVVLLAVWRGAGQAQDARPSWLFLILLIATCGAVVETGYRGGVNVYRYGVGVGE